MLWASALVRSFLPCKVAEPKRKPLLEHPELLPEHPDNAEHAEHAELAETLEHPIDEARALHYFILRIR